MYAKVEERTDPARYLPKNAHSTCYLSLSFSLHTKLHREDTLMHVAYYYTNFLSILKITFYTIFSYISNTEFVESKLRSTSTKHTKHLGNCSISNLPRHVQTRYNGNLTLKSFWSVDQGWTQQDEQTVRFCIDSIIFSWLGIFPPAGGTSARSICQERVIVLLHLHELVRSIRWNQNKAFWGTPNQVKWRLAKERPLEYDSWFLLKPPGRPGRWLRDSKTHGERRYQQSRWKEKLSA